MSFILNILGGGGSGISSPVLVPNASNASAGMVAVPAGNTGNPDQVVVGTTAARANYNAAVGIYAVSAVAGLPALIYLPGARIPTSVTGLGTGAYDTFAVATNVGGLVRKDVPDPGDMVVGTVDPGGILHFAPVLKKNSDSDGQNPGMRGATDFSAPVGDALQRRIEAAFLNPSTLGLGYASKRIELEAGWFSLDHPLLIWRGWVELCGQMASTHLYTNGWAGPAIVCQARREPPYLAINDFAGGNSMILDPKTFPQDDKFLEISEFGSGLYVDGWAGFEIDFIIQKTANGIDSYGNTVIASGGSRYASDPGSPNNDTTIQTAFVVNLTGAADGSSASAVFFQLTTATGVHFMFSPPNSLTVDGNKHRVKCNYDGANMRIIIDNVVVATSAQTGAVKQYQWEQTNIGKGIPYCFNSQWQTDPCFAKLSCIQIRDAASQTTSGTLTPPTTKYAYPPVDSHISFVCNFDDFWPPLQVFNITAATNTNPVVVTTSTPHGLNPALPYPVAIENVVGMTVLNDTWQVPTVVDATHVSIGVVPNAPYTSGGIMLVGAAFTKAYTRASASGTAMIPAFYPTFHDNPATSLTPRTFIHDLVITSPNGDGIVLCGCPESRLDNVSVFAKGGIRPRDNCFEFTMNRCAVNTAGPIIDRRVQCLIGPAGYMATIRQSSFSNGNTGIVATFTDISVYGCYIDACIRAAMIYGAQNLTWYGMHSFSDEGGPPGTNDDQCALIGVSNAIFNGVQIAQGISATHNVVVDQVHAFTLVANITFDGCLFALKSPDDASRTVPGRILARAGRGNPLKGTMKLRQQTFSGSVVPWIDPASDANYPIILETEGSIGTRSINIAGLSTYAMTRDDILYGTVIFTGALVATCAVTVGAVNLGPRYFIDATTGVSAAVTLKTSGGTNVLTIPKSPLAVLVRFDGTDVRNP